jgi:mRNA-degrading endonuclease RelE of RelBE toxin-antitoxin system
MSYNIEITALFEKQLKRLTKKFPSLKSEFSELIKSIKHSPGQGTSIGNNYFKIRIAIASKGKGKSGGGRIITHVKLRARRFICYQFTTNQNKVILLIMIRRNG